MSCACWILCSSLLGHIYENPPNPPRTYASKFIRWTEWLAFGLRLYNTRLTFLPTYVSHTKEPFMRRDVDTYARTIPPSSASWNNVLWSGCCSGTRVKILLTSLSPLWTPVLTYSVTYPLQAGRDLQAALWSISYDRNYFLRTLRNS